MTAVELMTASDRDLLRRYHEEGDATAREVLVERHLPLVRSLASCSGVGVAGVVTRTPMSATGVGAAPAGWALAPIVSRQQPASATTNRRSPLP